eukprot:Rhum_TRINITY_DN14738_c9_g2::Rhum_TRINITY_DN14738_c9_g2_i1::g.110638::m.110638
MLGCRLTASMPAARHPFTAPASSGISKLFLDRGSAAITMKNRRGETPLHFACRCGSVEYVTLLLDRAPQGCTVIDEKDEQNPYLHLLGYPSPGPVGARRKRVMAANAGGTPPEQLEQVRAAEVAHPAASTSAHADSESPCEVEWRRA